MYPLDSFEVAYTNRHKGLSALNNISTDAKLIDFDLDGGSQFIRLYVGAPDLEKWWGDDWDDCPYEHNAGEVYLKFVTHVIDVALPASVVALEPATGELNSSWAKENMQNRMVCMVAVTGDGDRWGRLPECFKDVQGTDKTHRIFMGDKAVRTVSRLVGKFGAQIMNVYVNKETKNE